MDLNVPLPREEDDGPPYNEHVEREIARKEAFYENGNSEGRYSRLKRKFTNEGPPMHVSQSLMHDERPRDHGSYDGNMLPPGWLGCPPYGEEIGFIIPSKVPLGESFSSCIPGEKYSPKQVIYQQRLLGRELGLVIDLTNTNRYYPVSAWTEEGIRHVKIRCKGRDSVPDNASVEKFIYEVSQFYSQQRHPKKYILVHCTHGHNRTGYMIVHFLMRTESTSVTEAIDVFARARHPGIYKQEYIDALYVFYHEEKPVLVVCPQTPEWKRSSDLDCNGEALLDQSIDGAALLHEDNIKDKLLSNDDILGDAIPFDQVREMRQACYQSLKLDATARGYSQFPGSHPVSLNRDNLQLLRQRYYYATWKADGTRYMMLITGDGCYLIDRNFNFRRVEMRFPCKYSIMGIPEKTHHYTLLDGEMIIDTDPNTQNQERRYLIYDMMAINEVSVSELPFHERWKMLEKEVIEPRNLERETLSKSVNPYYRYDLEPFSVRRKGFWLLSTVNKLLKKFIPQLSHEADGLIFQGWDDPYVPRTHEGLLKWKYSHMNSVDFLFELGVDNHQLLYLYERGRKKLMWGNSVVFEDASAPNSCSGKIIECSWDPDGKFWIFMRIRTDKSTPNDFNTYKKVLRSIKDNITEDVLFKEIDEIIRLPMYADRIQNDIKAHQHSTSARRR
ncbi:DSPc domain-containing protein/mRNA_cap_enzyme domain-containing protein/mRNA_cap_C domain-containing protein [Cephalotus follicularis]|uniref:mRNA guanylyltransferase n=1 Tax=Cephalotus follicularis TaxID=3775 RepID=A0A1Q3CR48_CEPFO|nr:DSPc domain-containing protein/mRNA_cap_enzyme domain-containing protein/mRNA_cap_C domain-containing protein [Cephalotus follicularis]